MILYIFLNQNLTVRIESEIVAAYSGSGELDIDKLVRAPLLNSVYHETLRLRVAGTVGRRCPGSDFYLVGGRQINRNELMMFTNWLGGLDESFWNTGPPLSGSGPAYPVESFWAKRFLRYPDETLGGQNSSVKCSCTTKWLEDDGGRPQGTACYYWYSGTLVSLRRGIFKMPW
jgi:hypothetical protein